MIEPNGTPLNDVTTPSLRQSKASIITGKGQKQNWSKVNSNSAQDRPGMGDLPPAGQSVTIGVQAEDITPSHGRGSDKFDLTDGPPTINISGSDRPDVGDYGPTIAHSGVDNISGPGKGRQFLDGRTIGTPIELPEVPAKGYGVMPDPGMGGPTPKIPAPID